MKKWIGFVFILATAMVAPVFIEVVVADVLNEERCLLPRQMVSRTSLIASLIILFEGLWFYTNGRPAFRPALRLNVVALLGFALMYGMYISTLECPEDFRSYARQVPAEVGIAAILFGLALAYRQFVELPLFRRRASPTSD